MFLHDTATGTTDLVSTNANDQPANGPSWDPSVSDDGRYVVFTSSATNLVPNDTNGAPDVFLYDEQTGVTQRVSVDYRGNQLPDGGHSGRISGQGNAIAYVTSSPARQGAEGACDSVDTNSSDDVYVFDPQSRYDGGTSLSDRFRRLHRRLHI